jgi:hypothetical protein
MAGGLFVHPPIHALPPWFGLTLTAVVCGGAFWKGDREQQAAALGVLLSWLATILLRDPRWIGPQWGAFIADTILLLVLTAIAIRTQRYWPLVAAAFQLLCVMTHVTRMVDPGIPNWAYDSGQIVFTDMLLIVIGVGVWNTWRAQAQGGASR